MPLPTDPEDPFDALLKKPRQQIDTTRGNPLNWPDSMKRAMPDAVKSAAVVQQQNDILDRTMATHLARQAQAKDAEARRVATEQERARKASEVQAKKDANTARETEFRTKGIQMFTDANGDIRPVTDENGAPRFYAKKGAVEYPNGDAVQTVRDETGKTTVQDLDKGAKVGSAPNAMGRVFRQDKQSPWNDLGSVEEAMQSGDPAIREAAQKAKDDAAKIQHEAAKKGFEVSKNEIAYQQAEAMKAATTAEQRRQQLQTQIDAKRRIADQRSFIGGQSAESKQAQAEIDALTLEQDQLTKEPDPKEFTARQQQIGIKADAFEFSVFKNGIEGATHEIAREEIAAQRDPNAHPVIKSVQDARKKAGLEPIDFAAKDREQEQQLRNSPFFGPVMEKRDAITSEATTSKERIFNLRQAAEAGDAKAAAEHDKAVAAHNERFSEGGSAWSDLQMQEDAANELARVDGEVKREKAQKVFARISEVAQTRYVEQGGSMKGEVDAGVDFPAYPEQIAALKAEAEAAGIPAEKVDAMLDDTDTLRGVSGSKKAFVLKASGTVAVDPALALYKNEWDAAVNAAGATPEAKEKAEKARIAIRDGKMGEDIYNSLLKSDSFQNYVTNVANNTEGKTAGELVEEYMTRSEGLVQKVEAIKAAATNIGPTIAQQVFGLTAMITGNELATSFLKSNPFTGPLMASIGDAGIAEVNKQATELMQESTAEASKLSAVREGMGGAGTAGFLLDTAGSIIPSLVPGGIIGRVGLGVTAARVAMGVAAGAQSAGGMYADAYDAGKRAGLSDEAARSASMLPAAAGGLLTSLLTTKFSGGLERMILSAGKDPAAKATAGSALKSYLKNAAKEAGLEMPEEGLDQLGQGIIAQLSYDPNKSAKDIFSEAFTAAIQGGLGAGFVSVASHHGERQAMWKQDIDQANDYLAKAEPVRQRFSVPILEGIGAFEAPSQQASELGATDPAGLKIEIEAADTKIEAATEAVRAAKTQQARAETAKALQAAHQERNALLLKLKEGAKFEDAAAQIEDIGADQQTVEEIQSEIDALTQEATAAQNAPQARFEPNITLQAQAQEARGKRIAELQAQLPTAKPAEEIRQSKIIAAALVKVAKGTKIEALTAEEKKLILDKHPKDGLPRVEMVKGPDGTEHPVILDKAISRLEKIAPAAAELIGQDEKTIRADILAGKRDAKSAPTPAATPDPAGATPAPVTPPTTTPVSGQPMRALTQPEISRVNAFRRMLNKQGIPDALADRVARGYVSANPNTVNEPPNAHKDGIMAALEAAGGKTQSAEPDLAKRNAANKNATAALEAGDVASLNSAQSAAEKEELFRALEQMEKNGPLTDDQKVKLIKVVKIFTEALKRWNKAFSTVTWTETAQGSGGALSNGAGNLTISIADVLAEDGQGKQLTLDEFIANPERANLIIREEAIHAWMQANISKERATKLWEEIGQKARDMTSDLYHGQGQWRKVAGGTMQFWDGKEWVQMNPNAMFNEFIRYVVEGKIGKDEIAGPEQNSPTLLARIKKILKDARNFFMNVSAKLKAEGVDKSITDEIDAWAKQCAIAIQKIAGDAEASDPYLSQYVARSQQTSNRGGIGGVDGGSATNTGGKGGNPTPQPNPTAGSGGQGKGSSTGTGASSDKEKAELKAKLDKAEAELEARKAKDEAAMRRRQMVNSTAGRLADFEQVVASVPADKQDEAKALLASAVPGDATYVVIVNQKRHPASYMALPPGVVQTSHLPNEGFRKNPNYGGENTRKYESDPVEQQKVRNIAAEGALDEGSVVTNVKSAADGPPQIAIVISADGKVAFQTAGGNGREMGMNMAGADDANRVADEWQAQAATYGFDNLPAGYRGYRFLGVFDLRQDAQAKAYQRLVDDLNPAPGVIAGSGQRAEIDARTKISPEALSGVSLDISTTDAVAKLTELMQDADKLGLDRNLMNSILADAPNAQLYVQKLLLASAFRSPVLSTFYFDSTSFSGSATVRGLIKAATAAAVELRTKNADSVADSIARTLETITDYLRNGSNLKVAIGKAAEQQEMGEGAKVVQSIATALQSKVVYREQMKNGAMPVDSDATIEGFTSLFEDITRAVGAFDPTPDMFGTADTIEATLERALTANARKSTADAPMSKAAIGLNADPKRLDGDKLESYLKQEGVNVAALKKPSTTKAVAARQAGEFGRALFLLGMHSGDSHGSSFGSNYFKIVPHVETYGGEQQPYAGSSVKIVERANPFRVRISDHERQLSAITNHEAPDFDTSVHGTPFEALNEAWNHWSYELQSRRDIGEFVIDSEYAPKNATGATEAAPALDSRQSLDSESPAPTRAEDVRIANRATEATSATIRREGGQSVDNVNAQSAPRSKAPTDTGKDARRMRTLQTQQREEGLTQAEERELELLEKQAGQRFLEFFDDVRKTPAFSSVTSDGKEATRVEQMALLSKRAVSDPHMDALRAHLKRAADDAEAELPQKWRDEANAGGFYTELDGFQPAPGLSRDERMIEAHFAWMIANDIDGMLAQYEELAADEFAASGYVGADLARNLYPEYAKSKRLRLALDRATISPTGWLMMRRAWPKALADTNPDHTHVLLLAGGMASGKTTAAIRTEDPVTSSIAGVADRVFYGYGALKWSIEEVQKVGKTPVARFVYRPFEKAAEGAILRAIKSGRPVHGLGVAHYNAQQAFLRAHSEFAASGVSFAVYLNDGGIADIRSTVVDALAARAYGPTGDERRKQSTETERARSQSASQKRAGEYVDRGGRDGTQEGDSEARQQTSEGLVVQPAPLGELSGTDEQRIAQLEAYYRRAIESARDHGIRVTRDNGVIEIHKLDAAEVSALTYGHIGDISDAPMAKRVVADPNQGGFDFGAAPSTSAPQNLFANNPVTNVAPNRKDNHANKPTTNPRPNDDAIGWDQDDLFMVGLQANHQQPGKAPSVDSGKPQAGPGLGANATPGRPEGGGVVGTGDGVGGRGTGVLGGNLEGESGANEGGVSGALGAEGSGTAANQHGLISRPAVGSPDRNAVIDPTRNYAPKQGNARFTANMDAIRLMRTLESEKRNATTEEKETLLAYTGWGWMKEAFNKVRGERWKQKNDRIRAAYDSAKRVYDAAQGTPRQYYAINPGAWESYLSRELEAMTYTDDDRKLASWAKNYLPFYEQLRAELSNEEFDAAAKSVRNAHYTDVPVIGAMWGLVERLGFKGGKATEPGGGIGHFIGAQPEGSANRTTWNAVELDGVTARILAHLYPEANVNGTDSAAGRTVEGQGFQQAKIPNNSQDLFISNVPFAKEGPAQSEKEFGKQFNLHNYFFARAFAKTKPGGLVVFITSNSTMDNNLDQRKALAAMGDLVGAIRLPNTAFKANAGTEVTTDILVFRKPDGKTPGFTPQDWIFTRQMGTAEVTAKRPEGQGVLDWLKSQPNGWVPVDPVVAEAFAAWRIGKHPASGQKAQALMQAIRGTGEMWKLQFIAPVVANEYFTEHPEHALGTHSLQGNMYGANEYSLAPHAGQDLIAQMNVAIASFPENIAGSTSADTGDETSRTAAKTDRVGTYIERNDEIFEVGPEGLTAPDWAKTPSKAGLFREWNRLRDAYNTLIALELSNDSQDADIEGARADLNRIYDGLRFRHHALAQVKRNKFAFLSTDPDYIPLQCLEVVTQDMGKDGKPVFRYDKADIFTKRQIQRIEMPTTADTLEEAVLFSMTKNGFLHPPYVAELLNISEAEATARLLESKLSFINPSTGLIEVADSYLSGNVSRKLDEALEAGKDDPRYRANIEALQSVQPPWQSIAALHPNLRANWVPAEVIQSFAQNALGLTAVVVHRAAGATQFDGHDGGNTDSKFTGGGMDAAAILSHIIGDKRIVVKVKERQNDGSTKSVVDSGATSAANAAREAIETAFDEYVKTTSDTITIGEEQTAVTEATEKAFNKHVGGWVPPTFNGDWITLPGQSGEIYLDRGFRKSVLARFLTQGYGMMAHGVGSGKTLTQVALVMELRRLGKAKKPVIVVEKSTIGQFASSFRRAYPQAKLLVAGENNFGPKDRAKFLGMMQAGDWDAIIMTRPQVTKIPHDESALTDFIVEKLSELNDAFIAAEEGSKSQSHIQAQMDKLEEMIRKMGDALRENSDFEGVTWEKLGVDAIVVDEAHNFKNTFVQTNKENVKNLPTGQFAQQAISMELKTANVRNRNAGKGIFFATGTPVSNAMHEAWVMIRYIAPHILKENGVETFDQFADTYGQTVVSPEANWGGEVKDVTRFAKFIHGQSLIAMIRSVFDVAMGNAKLGLDVPQVRTGQPELRILPQTPPMEIVNDWIVNSVARTWTETFGEKDENGMVITPGMRGLRDYIEANPWVTAVPIMTMQAGIAAALDPRMLHDKAEDHPGSKVNTAVREILERYNDPDLAEKRTTQVVFSDLRNSFNMDYLEQFTGVNPFSDLGPNERKFDLYEDIAKKLIAGGMKPSEVGWMESGMTDEKKEAFFAKVNSGEIRVVIGGEGISTGVNIQDRLGHAYHLMPPRNFKPAQQEQRNGRIIRQGNLWAEWAHNAFVDAAEKATGKKFAGKSAFKRRAAAEKYLAELPPRGAFTDYPAMHRRTRAKDAADAAAKKYHVVITEFGMEKSLDSAVYSMMSAKQGFIGQILSGSAGAEFEDPTDSIQMSMAEMAAQTIGDPRLIRKIEIERELKKLKTERAGWVSKRAELVGAEKTLAATLPLDRKNIVELERLQREMGDMFEKREKDAEGRPQQALYEMGDGTRFDPEAKREKDAPKDGIYASINRYMMNLWAGRKGNAQTVSGEIKINGVPIKIEVEDILGGGDEGMPGSFKLVGQTYGFRGAQSLIGKLHRIVDKMPEVTARLRSSVDVGEKRLAKARESLEGYPATFAKEALLQELTDELQDVKRGITAATQARNAARRSAASPTPAPVAQAGDAPLSKAVFADTGSVQDLVTGNIGLAYNIADGFDNIAGSEKDDRRSEARKALIKAARSYDPAKGQFPAFAGTVIRNAMRDYNDKQGGYAKRNITTLDAPLGEEGEDTAKDMLAGSGDVESEAQSAEMRQSVRDAIAALPPKLAEVVEGIGRGDTYESIGSRQGISKQGVGKKAIVALRLMRQHLQGRGVRSVGDLIRSKRVVAESPDDEIARLYRIAKSEESGKRTIGRPDLSLGALNELVMAVDEWRKTHADKQSHKQWEDDAEKMLANDYAGTKARIIAAGLRGDQLSSTEVKAAMQIVVKEVQRAAADPDNADLQSEVQQLVSAYRDARAEQARGLAAGRDPLKSPADRHREFLAKIIYQPPPAVQKKLDEAKTPDEKQKILSEDAKRIARIQKALADMGITFDDIFSGEVELRLKNRKIVENELKAAKGKDSDILKAFQEKRSFAVVAADLKVSEAEVKRVVAEAAKRIRDRHFGKFQKGATMDNVIKSAPAIDPAEAEFAKFMDSLGLTEQAPQKNKGGRPKKPKGRPFDINDPVAVVRIARTIQSVDSSALDMAMEWWMNNILSGPATHAANITGNAVSTAWDMTVQRGAEALVNLAFRRKDAAQLGEAKYLLRGLLPGIQRGLAMAQMAWTAEYDFTDHVMLGAPVDLQDISSKIVGRRAIPGAVGRIIRIPGRALMFADSFFKGVIAQMEVGAHAYRIAKAEGLKEDKLEARIKELVDQPGSVAWYSAVERSKELTFQQDLKKWGETHNPAEAIARAMQDATGSVPPLRFIIPFIRTPFNIMRAGLRKTPLGSIPLAWDALSFAASTGKNWISKISGNQVTTNPELPADFVRGFAEQSIAWTILALIWGAVQGDDDDDKKQILITGSSPRTEATRGERELQKRAYGGDYMIRIGGRGGVTFNFARYEPAATVLGTMADAVRSMKRNTDSGDQMNALWGYTMAQVESKSFLRGISDMMAATRDSADVKSGIANMFAQALVPNIIRQPLRNLDEYERDAKGGGFWHTLIPSGANAEIKRDVFGTQVEKTGNGLSRMVITPATKTETTLQPADRLLLRWNTQNPTEKYAPQTPSRTYRDPKSGRDVEMTPAQFADYTRRAGSLAKTMLAGKVTERQINNPTEKDVEAIKQVFTDARRTVREQMFGKKKTMVDMMWK